MNQPHYWIGIDVAKDHLDVHIRPSAELFQVANTDAGITQLVQRLEPLHPMLVVLEATGGLEFPAAVGLNAGMATIRAIRYHDVAKTSAQQSF